MPATYTNSPYKEIPQDLLPAFTLEGSIPVLDWWHDSSPNTGRRVRWTDKKLEQYKASFTEEKIRAGTQEFGSYAGAALGLLEAFQVFSVTEKRVAVIGSRRPWIEAILLNMDNDVTTVEYNVPEYDGTELRCVEYWDFERESREEFDVVVTFSSIEHAGLGRYGDPLDPEGDVKAMESIRRSLKPQGLLVWGAPVGADALVWNAHRVYGRLRLPLIFQGFEELSWMGVDKESLLDSELKGRGAEQPVVVLRKVSA